MMYFLKSFSFEYVSERVGVRLNERWDGLDALSCCKVFSLFLFRGGRFLGMACGTASWLDHGHVESVSFLHLYHTTTQWRSSSWLWDWRVGFLL